MTKKSNPADEQGDALTPEHIATMRALGWSEEQIEAERRGGERIRAAGGFREFVHKAEAARRMSEATGTPVEPEHLERTHFADAAELLAEQQQDENTASPPAWWVYMLALESAQRNSWTGATRAAAEVQYMRTLEAAADRPELLQYPSLEPWPKGKPLPPRWREGLFLRRADLRTWAAQHAPHWLKNPILAEPGAAPAEPTGIIHSTKPKRAQPLDAEIEAAKREAIDASSPHAVFAVLQHWAEQGKRPLIGFAEGEGIKYLKAGGTVGFFTLDALRKRMSRAA